MKKKILVFTGSRADYGLLKPLIKLISKSSKASLVLVAAGQHFSKTYGSTYREILEDKFKINYLSKINLGETKDLKILDYISQSLIDFSKYLKKNRPDMVILLGDRYEVYSFCISCFFLNIPITHIHGGEITTGAFDDSLRHSITKMSNFHFSCHKNYRSRIIRLGENPKFVFNYGSLGVENAIKINHIDKKKLFKKFSVPLNKKCFLVTYHPETKKIGNLKKEINIFLSAIKDFKDVFFIFTYSNSDPFGKYYIEQILKLKKSRQNMLIVPSLGSRYYLSFLKNCDCIIGNSSSGIIEAPALKTPTINIGQRQDGREFSISILTCKNNRLKIKKLIKKVILNNNKIKFDNLFFEKDTSRKIFNKILEISSNLNKSSFRKYFYEKK